MLKISGFIRFVVNLDEIINFSKQVITICICLEDYLRLEQMNLYQWLHIILLYSYIYLNF